MIQYFYPEQPRLLSANQSLFVELSQDRDWVAEPKINGSRLQLHHLPNGEWQFWGRHGESLKYCPTPEVIGALVNLNLSGYWLFDGELRDKKVQDIRNLICLYDLFIMDGKILINKPFRERRTLLENLVKGIYPGGGTITLPKQFHNNFYQVFKELTKNREIEGLVLKNLNGFLRLGRKCAPDSPWMWKVRKPNNSYRI